MKKYRCEIVKIILIAFLATSFMYVTAIAENRVDLGCPQEIDEPISETFVSIPVYFSNDVSLTAFSLGFVHNSSDIEIDSFHIVGSIINPQTFFPVTVDISANTILVSWVDLMGTNPITPQSGGLAFTLIARIPGGTDAQCVDIDSTFVPPAANFSFFDVMSSPITPNYYDCDLGDIIIGEVSCENNPPVALCTNVSADADANCEATETVDNGSYDPDSDPITVVQTPPGPYALGENSVMLTVTDNKGLADTCYATITVEDNSPPVLTCPSDISTGNDIGVCGATVTFSASATDNCDPPDITYDPPSGTFFTVGGSTQIQVVATDDSDNSDTCYFNVTVNDTEYPVAVCPGDTTLNKTPGECGAVVSYTTNATDNCPGVTVEEYPSSGSFFEIGTTQVTVIAVDAYGLADTCYFDVTIIDNEAPVAICPDDITVDNDPGECGAIVSFAIDATDDCPGVSVGSVPASGSFFPVGTTEVMVLATDASSNKDTCYFDVTVNDTEAPSVNCPTEIIYVIPFGQTSAIVEYSSQGSDNCGDPTVNCTPPSGSEFPIGQTPVECIITDAADLADTCQFIVTVITQGLCGDVNCDGLTNVSDAVWIINYVFVGGFNPCDSDGDGIPDC
jgi:HYR domain